MAGALVDKTEIAEVSTARPQSLVRRAIDAVLVASLIILSSIAVILVAAAAPIILALTAIGGFFTRKDAVRHWRPINI